MTDEKCETAFDEWHAEGMHYCLVDVEVNAREIWKAAWLEAIKQTEGK